MINKYVGLPGLGYFKTCLENLFAKKTDLDSKVNTGQGQDNYGKILTVNESGNVEPLSAPASANISYNETEKRLVFSNKTNLAGNVNVDPTLSTSGDAADAKAIGDRLTNIESQIENILNILNEISSEKA